MVARFHYIYNIHMLATLFPVGFDAPKEWYGSCACPQCALGAAAESQRAEAESTACRRSREYIHRSRWGDFAIDCRQAGFRWCYTRLNQRRSVSRAESNVEVAGRYGSLLRGTRGAPAV